MRGPTPHHSARVDPFERDTLGADGAIRRDTLGVRDAIRRDTLGVRDAIRRDTLGADGAARLLSGGTSETTF
ncbi:MAG: hypothetical protein ACM3ZE_16655 [Myxococcales bacterium]